MTKMLLDSGDPQEYKTLSDVSKTQSNPLWGATTNPSLIAKKLAGQKVTFEEAFSKLQKNIVEEILTIVPGAVSAEVYSDELTSADSMIEQGRQIATWGDRVVVKLPTTLEGFKARTALRKDGILTNNTLVFSQQQIFAVLLHEQLLQNEKPIHNKYSWSPFISPFVGRLDDKGENGMDVIEHGIALQKKYFSAQTCWILESSVRDTTQLKKGLDLNVAMMTVRFSVLKEWYEMTQDQRQQVPVQPPTQLIDIPVWEPTDKVTGISSLDEFYSAIEQNDLDISHPLTTSGIDRFVSDWQQIIVP